MSVLPVIVSDESVFCSECEPETACGNGHLYVVQLHRAAQDHFTDQSRSGKGVLYVGSTGKGVHERFLDNFRLQSGEVLDPRTVLAGDFASENEQWHYTSQNTKRIRRHYWRHRPDLLLRYRNPIVREAADPDKLERLEAKLADRLRNRGWLVFGPTRK